MNYAEYTTRCKFCEHKVQVRYYGIFAPLAFYASTLRMCGHALIHHRGNVDGKALFCMGKVALCGLGVSLLTLFRAVTYIFYPLYLLLEWWYG